MISATEPIIAHRSATDTLAFIAGAPIPAGRFVADVLRTARALPPGRHLLNACENRYAFAVVFCATLVAGRVNVLPNASTAGALTALARRYDGLALAHDGLADAAYCSLPVTGVLVPELGRDEQAWPPPAVARAATAAVVFTSGSTGEPLPQSKHFAGLVDGARAEARALGLDGPDLALLGTVPPQHMYGLESTVLLALHGPFAFASERPLHPEQVAAALGSLPHRRVLVTTPVHLRALTEASVSMPPLDRVVCATAPLDAELARTCEQRWSTRLLEVYGCSETGMVATRRTVDGPWWHAMDGVVIEARGEDFWASGGHVAQPGVLADRLTLRDSATFRLEGRNGDVVNVAGKRTSLAALNHLLLSLPGVDDGAFFLPQPEDGQAPSARETRLAAVVATRTLDRQQVLDALRERIDPVFLPRPLWLVDKLPRDALGKLPRARLQALGRTSRGS